MYAANYQFSPFFYLIFQLFSSVEQKMLSILQFILGIGLVDTAKKHPILIPTKAIVSDIINGRAPLGTFEN